MKNRVFWLRIAILIITLASLASAWLVFPLCLEEYNHRLIETADWDEVVGLYFIWPFLPFSGLILIGVWNLFLSIKLWCKR